MKLHIKRIDQSLPLPLYQTNGSIAFDLYARLKTIIKPKTIKLIPTNLIIKTPPCFMLLIAARSSTPLKKGLMLANGIGIIDQDYCGKNDEIKVLVYNFTNNTVTVKKKERIAQAILVKIARASFTEANETKTKSRGGFGSTG